MRTAGSCDIARGFQDPENLGFSASPENPDFPGYIREKKI
jgi:hypothetical protein